MQNGMRQTCCRQRRHHKNRRHPRHLQRKRWPLRAFSVCLLGDVLRQQREELRVKEGADVKKGDPLAVLSAMKMVSLINTLQANKADILLGNGYLGTPQRQGCQPASQGGRLSGWLGPGLQDYEGLIRHLAMRRGGIHSYILFIMILNASSFMTFI